MTQETEREKAFAEWYDADFRDLPEAEIYIAEAFKAGAEWQARARVGRLVGLQNNLPANDLTKLNNSGEVEAEFWRDEYRMIAEAGVERMAELGVECDPASKMIDAAEYRLRKKLTATQAKPVEVGVLASDIRKACAIPAINYALKDGAIDWEAMANGQATAAAQAILERFNVTEK